MCGLFGAFGDLRSADIAAVKDLAIMSGLRGLHSAGIGSVSGLNRDFSVIKTLGGPQNLLSLRDWDTVVTTTKSVILGHARHATMGAITHENAHPFDTQYVLGTHNGTLTGDWRTALGESTSDSRALMNALNIAEKATEVFEKISGAWAVAWYDKATSEISLLRNSERPLHYAEIDDGRCIIYASEYLSLYYALAREGRYTKQLEKIYELPVNTRSRWELTGACKIERLEDEQCLGKSPPPVVQSYYPNYGTRTATTTASTGIAGLVSDDRVALDGTIVKASTFPSDATCFVCDEPIKFVSSVSMNGTEHICRSCCSEHIGRTNWRIGRMLNEYQNRPIKQSA